jgi:hypothetical protein
MNASRATAWLAEEYNAANQFASAANRLARALPGA